MSEAPKKIYWDVQDRIADENQDDPSEIPYICADIVDELVEALEAWINSINIEDEEKAMNKAIAALAKLEESHD